MARILVAALGSHRDVHPFIAVSQALKRRGHDVRMIAPVMYADLAKAAGVEFVGVGTIEQFEEFSSREELWDPMKGFEVVAEGAGEMLPIYYEAIVANHEPGETVLVQSTLVVAARIARETLRIPGATVHLSPACFRSSIDPCYTPPLAVAGWMPGWWNRFIFAVADKLILDRAFCPRLNEFRKSLGLKPVRRILGDWIHSRDRVIGLFPNWYAPVQADWPKQTVLTGFPLYDESDVTPVSTELEAFLSAGSPPMAFTPGSAMRHGDDFFDAAVGMCKRLNRRGILLSRHKQHVPGNLPPEILHLDFVPFSKLLPRCAAIVHHGGIGTCAQGLAAGIPQLAVSMSHDQPDNGRRLQRLSVGGVIPARKFTAERGAAVMKELLDEGHQAACVKAKGLFATQNPFGKTVELIEGLQTAGAVE
jgi:UDP:flavonoid glycosyltransferase YjiC (YdhE family)